jgi:capsular exopolysaccharide synthesis family protein
MQVLQRRWKLAVAVFLLVVATSAGITIAQTPSYSAEADVFVSVAPGNGTETLFQDSQFLLDKIQSYTQLANTPLVLKPVAKSLKVNLSVTSLGKIVTSTNVTGTSVINIQVSSTDPRFAAALANAVAKQIQPAIATLEPSGEKSTDVRATVITPATVPTKPVSPRTTLNILLGVMAGLLLGVGAAFLRDVLDEAVRSEHDLSQVTGLPTLAVIGLNARAMTQPLVVLDPTSLVTESFRSLRARLRFIEVDNPPRIIALTSSVPGEGKTTVATNLALTLAQSDSTVCLVDADLRRRSVAQFLGLDGSVGLSNVLAGEYPLDTALLSWGDGALSVLLAGTSPPDPGELLASRQMETLIAELSERFDYVVFDTPPLNPVADGAILGARVDGVIVVARYGKTHASKVAKTIASLKSSNAKVLGSVLNAAPRSRADVRYGRYEQD